jgi:hypothetical protein
VDALRGDDDDKVEESAGSSWAKSNDPAWRAYGVLRHRLKIAWWSAAQLLAAPKALHSSIRYAGPPGQAARARASLERELTD